MAASDQGRSWTTISLGSFILVAGTIVSYLPATQAGFIWDDDDYVIYNETLRTTDGLREIWLNPYSTPQYYPLVHTTFWLEYQCWQLDAPGYHKTNIIIHAASTVLLWRILVWLGVPGSWFAAAVFAIHPVHVESVAWITQRKNVLSGFFYLASTRVLLPWFLETPESEAGRRKTRYCLGLVLFLCALLSKTVTASLPAALLLVMLWKKRRIEARDVFGTLPLFLLAVPLGLYTSWLEKHYVGAQGEDWEFTFAERLLIAGRSAWLYAEKLIWPMNLTIYPKWNLDTSSWIQWLFPLAVAALIAGLWGLRKRFGFGPLVCVLFFGGTLVPALGFFNVFPMLYFFVGDHFQYLASIGLIVLLVAGFSTIPFSTMPLAIQRLAFVFTVAILPILGLLTFKQSRIYMNEEVLFQDTINKNPNFWMPYSNLAEEYQRQGKLNLAVDHFQKSWDLIKNNSDLKDVRVLSAIQDNWGNTLCGTGQFDKAVPHYKKAIDIRPDHPLPYNNCGNALERLGRFDEALPYYLKALQINPDFGLAHSNLGRLLLRFGEWNEAVEHLKTAIRLNPNNREAIHNLELAIWKARGVDR